MWSHLVSDASFEELHAFAAAIGAPRRAFERDHYDLPEERYADAVRAGAVEVGSKELVRLLTAAGLRRPRTPALGRRPRRREGVPDGPPAARRTAGAAGGPRTMGPDSCAAPKGTAMSARAGTGHHARPEIQQRGRHGHRMVHGRRRHDGGGDLLAQSTVRPDGRPHVTPLLAVWADDALHFCTGPGRAQGQEPRRPTLGAC